MAQGKKRRASSKLTTSAQDNELSLTSDVIAGSGDEDKEYIGFIDISSKIKSEENVKLNYTATESCWVFFKVTLHTGYSAKYAINNTDIPWCTNNNTNYMSESLVIPLMKGDSISCTLTDAKDNDLPDTVNLVDFYSVYKMKYK